MSIPSAVQPYPTVAKFDDLNVEAAKTAADAKAAKEQKDMFLKLLVAQLSNQDPSAPMDQKDMMAQMTQFTQVEQMTNMVSAVKDLSKSSALGQSVALIGKTVSYEARTADGLSTMIKSGKVTGMTNGATGITLQLDTNANIKATDVLRVAETPATPASPAATP